MSLLGTIVGIDPSGRRLALVARGSGLGRAVPPAVVALRADREQARFEEAQGALREFVARYGLAGSAARLCVPASRVYTARVSFPPLRDRDLRAALEIELERLFPVPASRLLFGWRRLGKAQRGKAVPLVVAAVPADYVERWQETVGRAGLTLAAAVPSAWALSSALSEVGGAEIGGIAAVLRDAGGDVECALFSEGEPFFTAVRNIPDGSALVEGLQALASGLSAVPGGLDGADLPVHAPASWAEKIPVVGQALGIPVRVVPAFERRAAQAISAAEAPEGKPAAFELLGAYGAAVTVEKIDFLGRGEEGGRPRIMRWASAMLGILVAFLAAAWPSIVAWKTRAEAARLLGELAALRPAVAQVEEALADLTDVEARITALQEAAGEREEMIVIVKELTDRLPQGTWLTGLRVENRKVEIDGLSAAANEIFPLLSRDGRFRKVEFASPITRQPDNIERFQIRAEFAPAADPQGGVR